MTIGLFIDGEYFAKTYKGRVDYLKVRQFVEKELGDTVDEAYFFSADEDPPKASKLHNALTFPPPKGPGFRVKIYWLSKKVLTWPSKLGGQIVVHPEHPEIKYELTTQKAVDVGLVYCMTRSHMRRKWNKLVLASGDGDFHEPIQNLVEVENVDLYILGSTRSVSEHLRSYARNIYEIDQDPLRGQLQMAGRM